MVYGKASGRPGVVTGDELLFGNRTAYGLAVGQDEHDATPSGFDARQAGAIAEGDNSEGTLR